MVKYMNEEIEKLLYSELKKKVEGGLPTRRGIMGLLKAGNDPEQAMHDLYYFLKSKKIVREEEIVAKMKNLRNKYNVPNVIVAKKAKYQTGTTDIHGKSEGGIMEDIAIHLFDKVRIKKTGEVGYVVDVSKNDYLIIERLEEDDSDERLIYDVYGKEVELVLDLEKAA